MSLLLALTSTGLAADLSAALVAPPPLSAMEGERVREMRPLPALGAGFVGAYVGGIPPLVTHPLVSFGTMPLGAAAGVHVFSNARYGWEALGGLAGFAVMVPVGLGIRRAIGVPVGSSPTFGAVNLAMTGVFALGTTLGATGAAMLDSKRREGRDGVVLSMSPYLTDTSGGLVVSGRM